MDGIQRLVPSPDCGGDGVRIFGPLEGPWLGVGLGDEAVDDGLERDEGVEDIALQALHGQPGEEALDRINVTQARLEKHFAAAKPGPLRNLRLRPARPRAI